MDSLTGVELRTSVANAFAVELPATVMYDYPTLDALTGFVAEQVAPVPTDDAQTVATAAEGDGDEGPDDEAPLPAHEVRERRISCEWGQVWGRRHVRGGRHV
jgi:hypothetical protein